MQAAARKSAASPPAAEPDRMQALLGIALLLLAAWAFSENRRAVPVRTLVVGLALQLVLALLFLKLPASRDLFLALNGVVTALQEATRAGTSLLFGYIGGGALPFEAKPNASTFILALQALPLVLLISALSAMLYHWRVLPAVVGGFAWALRKTLGIGGTAGVATAANVFVGMVEAPLLVKPYLARASRSELFVIMTAGLATIAGTMLVIYATFLQGVVPDAVGHLLTASVLNAPAAVVIARMLVPPAPDELTIPVKLEPQYRGTMDAVTRGTLDGLNLLLSIVALMIVLVALVALSNMILGLLPGWDGAPVTLQRLLGAALAPVTWLIGVPWAESGTAGALLGVKIVLNEFVSYLDMAKLPPDALSSHSRLVMVYAMCGFANFGSLGIMLGGLCAMAPERRAEIAGLGLKSLVAGVMTTCLTGALVGLL
jgi:CNT family concentrative nucleoside transporter